MKPLPQDFLNNIADEYNLTPKQKEAFIALYLQPNQSIENIARTIHISAGSFRTRMTGVYKKLGFGGKDRNKQLQLYNWLRDGVPNPPNNSQNNNDDRNDIEQLVNKIRQQTAKDIKNRCGKMQVIDRSNQSQISSGVLIPLEFFILK